MKSCDIFKIISIISLLVGIVYMSFKIRESWKKRNKEKMVEGLQKAKVGY